MSYLYHVYASMAVLSIHALGLVWITIFNHDIHNTVFFHLIERYIILLMFTYVICIVCVYPGMLSPCDVCMCMVGTKHTEALIITALWWLISVCEYDSHTFPVSSLYLTPLSLWGGVHWSRSSDVM